MIVTSLVENAPELSSNIKGTSTFSIKSSARAFSILSSGLYANKIRAIVRELSCNAVDSHTAAGRSDVPFHVHLPNTLETWFGIRDFGTGLSHTQVTQIYTTYFESTKTNSNDFIGALGLGSKSPFAYTENFTITAIQDGRKGIYTAFVNEDGVPSVALMTEEFGCDEGSGVEIKFSVENTHDFQKFAAEAATVFQHFKLMPTVTGGRDFKVRTNTYADRDIIPGVHVYANTNRNWRESIAIMGNIAYPIEIPSSDKSLDGLARLLNCGLEMHFAIGELDFQASREGLSYIPQTIEAIKAKVELVKNALAVQLATKVAPIINKWELAEYLVKKNREPLWTEVVEQYAKTNLNSMMDTNYSSLQLQSMSIDVDEIAKEYNISLQQFSKSSYGVIHNYSSYQRSTYDIGTATGTKTVTTKYWSIDIDTNSMFIINDTTKGAGNRAKYHAKNKVVINKDHANTRYIIIDAVDRKLPVLADEFFKRINNPPVKCIMNASDLMTIPKKESAATGQIVTILKLVSRNMYSPDDVVWRDAGDLETFNDKTTYFYIPLSGFAIQSTKGYNDSETLHKELTSIPGITRIYGIRKADIDVVKSLKNWVNVETYAEKYLASSGNALGLSVLMAEDKYKILSLKIDELVSMLSVTSPATVALADFVGVKGYNGSYYGAHKLYNRFLPNSNYHPRQVAADFEIKFNELEQRYPLLNAITKTVPLKDMAEYIMMVDTAKGV